MDAAVDRLGIIAVYPSYESAKKKCNEACIAVSEPPKAAPVQRRRSDENVIPVYFGAASSPIWVASPSFSPTNRTLRQQRSVNSLQVPGSPGSPSSPTESVTPKDDGKVKLWYQATVAGTISAIILVTLTHL